MKTRKQQMSEMVENLENDLVKQEIVHDYRQFVFEQDEKLKGNLEAQKELNASKFQLERTKAMLAWMNKQLIVEE